MHSSLFTDLRLNNMKNCDVDTKYYDAYMQLVGSDRFIGIQPRTLSQEDLHSIDSEWYYLVKYDGERRILFVYDGACFLIDRNNRMTFVPEWNGSFPVKDTLVLDGELLKTTSGLKMKIFDAMYLDQGKNIEYLKFTDRISKLSEYLSRSLQIDVWNGQNWCIVSTPYKVTELSTHLTATGDVVDMCDDFECDGIVLMKNTGYYRGTFHGCLKFKNPDMNSVDLQIERISPPKKKGSTCSNLSLVMMHCYSRGKFGTKWITDTTVSREDMQKYRMRIGSIIEFKYDFVNKMERTHSHIPMIPFRDRSDKNHPNGEKTVTNVINTWDYPVYASAILEASRLRLRCGGPARISLDSISTTLPVTYSSSPSQQPGGPITTLIEPSSLNVGDPVQVEGCVPELLFHDHDKICGQKRKPATSRHNTVIGIVLVPGKKMTCLKRASSVQKHTLDQSSTELVSGISSLPHRATNSDFDTSKGVNCQGVSKFKKMLELYVHNFENFHNPPVSTMELEFKLVSLSPQGHSTTGISEKYFNRILETLQSEFEPEYMQYTHTIDHITSVYGDKGSRSSGNRDKSSATSRRNTFSLDKNGVKTNHSCMEKTKIASKSRGGDDHSSYTMFDHSNTLAIKGTLSCEKIIGQRGSRDGFSFVKKRDTVFKQPITRLI